MRALLLPIVLPLLLSVAMPVAAQEQHGHSASQAASPLPARRWATDPALREGMARIRDAVALLPHYAHGHMSRAQLTGLASGIEGDVASIVSSCKLAPEADAQLHPIIAALIKGAQALKADPPDLDAATGTIDAAFADYARRFDDPGFATPGAAAGAH